MATIDDKLLIRRPVLDAENLVINAFKHQRTVTEVRVRWRPPQKGSSQPLGHFVIVVDFLSPQQEQIMKKIEAELGARVGPMPFDLCIDYMTPKEIMLKPEYVSIMRRPWEWYYQMGLPVPEKAKT